ncbi:MAG: flagellar hook-basal body complex protein FliE [Rhodospirillaceae bacterium]
MTIDFNTAVSAYKEAAASVSGAGGGVTPPGKSDGSFVNMVKDSLDSAMEINKHAEQVTMARIAGEASTMDVVTAVASAQHTLETVVAVRDKVLQAYQEVLRMPI